MVWRRSGILATLAIFTLILSGCGFGTSSSSTVSLVVSPNAVNFGNVPVGQTAKAQVALTNSGSAPVALSSLSVNGQAFFVTDPSKPPITLQPGTTYNVGIGFTPSSATAYSGEFTVMDSTQKQVGQVPIKGNGSADSPQLAESTAKLNFGDVTVGQTSTLPVTLTSSGNTAVTISSATITGAGFTISGATFPLTINPGKSAALNVRFEPSATGPVSGSLTLDSNSAGEPTELIDLSGTGAAAAEPQLTVSPTQLRFHHVTVGSSSTESVNLTSSGTSPVVVNSASISGAGFSILGTSFPLTLNPGQSAALQIRFAPTATGMATGQLTIDSNSSTNPSDVVGLSGWGTAAPVPQLSLSATSLTFGEVTVGSSSRQPVTLTSTGTAVVTISSLTLKGAGFSVTQETLPLTLNPGQAVTLQVEFAPTSTGGATGTLTIDSNSSTDATANVDLSGMGTPAPSPQLSLSEASLTFGDVTAGSSSTQPLTLTSTGTAAVTINSAAITGSTFSFSGASFPLTLNPHQAITLEVTFAPTAAGAVSGKLTVDSNSATNAAAVVNMSGKGTPAPSPQLSLSAASLTFGDVTVGSSSKQPVTLTSTGTAPVTISSLTPAGAGFSITQETLPLTLNPGQAVTLEVMFAPTATGAVDGKLTVDSNSSTNATAVVNMSGTGTPAPSPQLSLSTASLTFGNVTDGSSSMQPVTLTSSGTAPVTINTLTLTGAGFSVTQETLPLILNPGQAVTLQVTFAPTTTGAVTGTLTADSNSSTNATAVVNMSGTGTPAPSPLLSLSPASLTFGDVTVGSSSIQPVTLTSSGTAPVTINALTPTGAGFSVSPETLPLTLNPGQAVTLQVAFAPPTAAGAVTGTLTVDSNSATNPTAVINLSGTETDATSPQLSVSAASLVFGDVTDGSSPEKPLTLTSTGTAPVTISSLTLTGAEFSVTQETLPLTLNPGQAVTLQVTFAPTAAGAVSGKLTVGSNSSTNATAVVSVFGTGITPQLTISAASLVFGDVTDGSSPEKPITLTSTGTAPVTISSITLTGAEFSITHRTVPLTMSQGQAVTLEVTFAPTAVGSVSGKLTVGSNSSTNPTTIVKVYGTGIAPQLTVSAGNLSFGSVTVNTSSSLSATLTSSGTAAVTVNSAAIVGAGFTFSGATFPLKLAPAQTATLKVLFKPTATGAVTGKLTLTSNSSSGATSIVNLFGTGVAVTTPQLTVSPTSLSFGNVTVGTPPPTLPVTLTSSGTAAVVINSISLNGAGLSVSGASFPLTLNPTQKATLEVQFDPTSAGGVSGSLIINSTSSGDPAITVNISATGVAPIQHQVDLSWDAPSRPPVPVVGYNVYRATGSSTSFQLLNSSVVTGTTYVDSTVQSGASYSYYVESVAASGAESVPSNVITLAIPSP